MLQAFLVCKHEVDAKRGRHVGSGHGLTHLKTKEIKRQRKKKCFESMRPGRYDVGVIFYLLSDQV